MCDRYNTPSRLLCLFIACCAWAPSVGRAASPQDSPEVAELEAMLHEQAARRARAPKPALAPPTPAQQAPKQAPRAGKPPWVDGADPSYPTRSYLCAVGAATGREAAANAAYGNLAKTFVAHISTSSHDTLAHHQATGKTDETVQDIQLRHQVSSHASLQGVSIYETWQAPDAQVYAWACLDRARAAAALREQVATANTNAATWLERAATADKTVRLRALAQALEAAAGRDALVSQLRWLDVSEAMVKASGAGVNSTEVAARLAGTLRALRIGVWAEGDDTAACRAALVQSMVAHGYHASDVAYPSALANYDLAVVATTEMEHAGSTMVGDIRMQLVRGQLRVQLREGDAVLMAYDASQKAGAQSVQDARRRVLRGLAAQVTQNFGPKADAAVRGTLARADL